jgi:hypothetical protein
MYNEQAESEDRKMVERLKGEADGVLHAVRQLFLFCYGCRLIWQL